MYFDHIGTLSIRRIKRGKLFHRENVHLDAAFWPGTLRISHFISLRYNLEMFRV